MDLLKISENTELFVAKVISFISNPFVIIFFAIIVGDSEYIFSDPGPLLMFIVIGYTLPFIVYIKQLLHHKKHFWHFVSLERDTRNPVYFIAIYSFLFNVLIFSYLNLSFWQFQSILIFVFFCLMFLINKYIDKISMHAAAFSFSAVYLIDKGNNIFIILLFLLPLVWWARIKLHKHNEFQLFLGTVTGLFIGVLSWLIK